MIDAYDLTDVLYARAVNSALKTAITGDVYRDERPMDSTKEDVVINSLALDNQQIQTAVCNVNIYVPGITIRTAQGTQVMANKVREKELAAIAKQVFNYQTVGDYTFYVQQPPRPIKEENTGAFFINIRIQFSNINTENFINF